MRWRRTAVLAATLGAGLLGGAPGAWANGDPASHVLLVENVFYPARPVSQSSARALDGLTAEAKRKGFPIKVALIEERTDLGTVPSLFGQPKEYAELLRSEISFRGTWPLLVVMPDGVGASHTGPRTDRALAGVKVPADADPDALVRVAVEAVLRLAAVRGIRLERPELASGEGGGNAWLLLFAVPIFLAALGLALAARRRRGAAGNAPD